MAASVSSGPLLHPSQFPIPQVTATLTSVFTPPPSCELPLLTSYSDRDFDVDTTAGTSHIYKYPVDQCYPSQFVLANGEAPLYSPGACPYDYEVATDVVLSGSVTHAVCCPTYAAKLVKGDTTTLCFWTSARSSLTSINDGTTSVVDGPYVFEYPAITVAWQASDLPDFNPPSAPLLAYKRAAESVPYGTAASTQGPGASASTSLPASTRVPNSSGTAVSTTQQATSSRNGALSTGVKAGIGVGIAAGVALIIGLLTWALLERRKRQAYTATIPTQYNNVPEKRSATGRRAKGDVGLHEMEAKTTPEMSTDNTRAELESGWQGLEASPR
ncbi:hypothetical protein LTR37_010638 [Vermiconidia calcicola]|uniref:Uncharacterized protein n=1 Tax=Vermiconidia calcicola TaxID=1690605 RepID=A0ACC3N4C0_9PEZI|nr:hypothetical protein LTR37_010638 [Vermiconidia calcicola]